MDETNELNEDEEVLYCSKCGDEIEKGEEKEFDGNIYCEFCFADETYECDFCGERVPYDDTTYWGDHRICSECLDERCPSFDQDENDEETAEAYEAMRQEYIGRRTDNLSAGEHCFDYCQTTDETDIRYSISVTVDDEGVIEDISRLSAEMLLSEGATNSDWESYPICPEDYDWLPETIFDENIEFVDEDDEEIDWEDYMDYPFAMEQTNGEILSMTPAMQKSVMARLITRLGITEEQLAETLLECAADEAFADSWPGVVYGPDNDMLIDILGFDIEAGFFAPKGIGFLDSPYGWETKELMENLGYSLDDVTEYAPHGHGGGGVIFLEELEEDGD